MLRRAGPEDTEAICGLLADVFPANPKADPAVLRWQYWDNPYGAAAAWVHEEDGRLLGHYAVIAVPGRLAGAPARLGMGVDAATREEARGRGLFTALARAAYTGAAEAGYRATFTAPNPYSLRGVVNAGLQQLADLPVHVRPLDDAWLAARAHLPRPVAAAARAALFRPGRGLPATNPRRRRILSAAAGEALGSRRRTRAGPGSSPRSPDRPGGGRAGGLRAQEVPAPPEGLDRLWARTGSGLAWGLVSDAGWWDWRYARRPSPHYRFFAARRGGELVGAAAVSVHEGLGDRFLTVLDLLADDGAAAAAALAPAFAEPRGAVGAALVALPGSRAAALARAAGFRRLPRRLAPRPLHFGVARGDPALPDLTRVPWQVSWGLLDHL